MSGAIRRTALRGTVTGSLLADGSHAMRLKVDMKLMGCLLAVAMIVAAGGCMRLKERRLVSRLQGKPAPDFELTSLDGDKVKLSRLEGKPVVLAFWAYG